jgi:hypothetical protein
LAKLPRVVLLLGRLRICDLSDGRVLVRILVYRGVVVRNLSIGCALASKINSEATRVCGTNLVKWVSYKTRDPIKFERGKESAGFDVI